MGRVKGDCDVFAKKTGYLLAVFAVLAAVAAGATRAAAQIVMDPPKPKPTAEVLHLVDQASVNLGPYMRVIDDAKKNLSFHDVLAIYRAQGGKAASGDVVNADPSTAAQWYVFAISNKNPIKDHW